MTPRVCGSHGDLGNDKEAFTRMERVCKKLPLSRLLRRRSSLRFVYSSGTCGCRLAQESEGRRSWRQTFHSAARKKGGCVYSTSWWETSGCGRNLVFCSRVSASPFPRTRSSFPKPGRSLPALILCVVQRQGSFQFLHRERFEQMHPAAGRHAPLHLVLQNAGAHRHHQRGQAFVVPGESAPARNYHGRACEHRLGAHRTVPRQPLKSPSLHLRQVRNDVQVAPGTHPSFCGCQRDLRPPGS